jgi:L-histidine N-alpha-methyltransferase
MATQPFLHASTNHQPGTTPTQLFENVIHGLSRLTGKSLPSYHMYEGEHGMSLYHKLCAHEAYYPIRAEEELLESVGTMDILLQPLFKNSAMYVASLGPGKGRKDALLLDHLVNHQKMVCTFNPIDVCADACERAGQLITKYVDSAKLTLDNQSHGQEFLAGLHTCRDRDVPRLITYFGSTISNYEPPFNLSHLASIAANMDQQDYLLMGVDLMHHRKSITKIEAAYNNDPTREWVMNLLDYINTELSTDFRREDFDCRIGFDPKISGIRTTLVANRYVSVALPGTDYVFDFAAGEEVQIEVSMKYTEHAFQKLATEAGLQIVRSVQNTMSHFGLYLLQKAA